MGNCSTYLPKITLFSGYGTLGQERFPFIMRVCPMKDIMFAWSFIYKEYHKYMHLKMEAAGIVVKSDLYNLAIDDDNTETVYGRDPFNQTLKM